MVEINHKEKRRKKLFKNIKRTMKDKQHKIYNNKKDKIYNKN